MANRVSDMTQEELFNTFVGALRAVNVGGGGRSSSSPYYNFISLGTNSLAETFSYRNTQKELKEAENILIEYRSLIEQGKKPTKELSDKIKELGFDFDEVNENGSNTVDVINQINNAIDKIGETSTKYSFGERLIGYNNIIKKIGGSLKGIDQTIMGFVNPWAKADKAASDYVKTIGATKAGLESLRKSTIENVVQSKIGINYNMSTDELIEAQQRYIQGIGRSIRIDNTQQESLAAMHSVMQGREMDLAAAFENFGVNLNGVAEHAGKMFSDASKSGLSFEKYSDNVAKNIKIAQNYTFKNGLKGLEGMAKKAAALKLDMGQVASFADKVSTIEGSIDVASKLQVLGGQFAAIADPMAMLSEGLMDMEGLTDRVIKMVGGLGGFNKKTGEVEVSAFNKQRIKAAAQAMGIDYSQLMESVNTSARRSEVEKQINSSSNARGLNEDMQELIKNTASFNKEGKAGVSINGEFKTLDQLTNNDYKELVKETQSESEDIKDIAKNVRSLLDIRTGTKKEKEAIQARITERTSLGDKMKSLTDTVGRTNWLLGTLVVGQGISAVIDIFSNLKDIGSLIGRFGKGGKSTTGLIGGRFGNGGGNGGNGGVVGKLFVKNGNNAVSSPGKSMTQGAKKSVRKGEKKIGGRLATKFGESRLGENIGRKSVDAIKKVDVLGKELSQRGYTKIGGTLEKTALKQAKNIGLSKIPKYGGKKIAEATAKKVALKFATRAIKGGALGFVGAAGNIATDMLVDSGKIKKGGAAHTAMKVGSTALEGAAIGAILGPVGAAVGAAVGGIKMAKIKREMAIDNRLQSMGIERKGEYGARSYKLIDKALATGKISNRMRRKLERNGDIDILNAIEKKKEEKKEKASKRLSKGTFTVNTAYFNGNAFGASKISSALDLLNPIKMGQKKLEFAGSLLKGDSNRISKISGIPESGKKIKISENVSKYGNSQNRARNSYDINISGTITLVSGTSGKEVDITDKLLDNDTFITELTNKIINEKGLHNYGTNKADVNQMGRM